MSGMLKRTEGGPPENRSARMRGTSLRSVKRTAQQEPVVNVDDKVERSKRRIGRLSTVENFRKRMVRIVLEAPDLP